MAMADSNPIPELAPVMTTVLPFTGLDLLF
jgi:hypothetical protein